MAVTSTEYLSLDGIGVSYGDVVALPPLSLRINSGEFFCLLGPSGCGKTTTLNVIGGFVAVSSGRVVLNGTDITNLPPQKRQIGIVFQNYALFPHMTAAENIGYGLKLRKVPADELRRQVGEALALVRLEGKGDRYPKNLSGGEQQRVAIARALAIKPQLLLLDEPLSNLDARLREEMRAELKRIQRATGVTTVFVTHDQEEAFGAGDRIAVLNKGVVEQVGMPTEIYERPASPFVAGFIGRSNKLRGSYDRAGGAMMVDGHRFAVQSTVGTDLKDAVLYLRPEALRLNDDGGAANVVRGTIENIVYGGSTVEYRVATPVGPLDICRLASERPYAVGETASVSWPVSSGVVLDGAGD
jgi:putative spermidine/putrescine transport system ATP-binding protein